jgi:hypothetical protein
VILLESACDPKAAGLPEAGGPVLSARGKVDARHAAKFRSAAPPYPKIMIY